MLESWAEVKPVECVFYKIKYPNCCATEAHICTYVLQALAENNSLTLSAASCTQFEFLRHPAVYEATAHGLSYLSRRSTTHTHAAVQYICLASSLNRWRLANLEYQPLLTPDASDPSEVHCEGVYFPAAKDYSYAQAL